MIRFFTILLLVGGGVYTLQAYLQPELDTIRTIRNERKVVSDTINQAREVIRLRDELLARYNSISQEDINKIRKFLPAGAQVSQLLIDMDVLAGEAGITVQDISFRESTASAGGNLFVALNLDVAGSYEEVRSFIALLERNLRLVDVVQIGLGSADETGEMRFSITAHAHYQEQSIL